MSRVTAAAAMVLLLPLTAAAQSGAPAPSSQGPMVVERVQSGFLVAPDVKVTRVDGITSELAGAYAGWLTDGTIFVGGGGYWMANQSSDRRMAAIPAQLDPGPAPELPPAGWTPLRIGLVFGWVAAIVALMAVWFGGWTLIDLSERRIRFVSAVTHELRTPLTSLRLYLDLLASGMITDEAKQKEYLHTLQGEAERLNQLVDNVLDFAKLENRAILACRQSIPLESLLTMAKETWTDRLLADGMELHVISTLPPDQLVHTDVRIASQILGILIDNARKYSREASDRRIWVWAKPGDNTRLILEVEDRGPGVAVSERASIFRPFRRGRNSDKTGGGAGLGLALAKQWADALNGRLSYRPADGGTGAIFRLELPHK